MTLTEYTKMFTECLVGTPLSGEKIMEGMKILFAEVQPIGLISVQVGKVSKTYDGRLSNKTRSFGCVLPSGKEGKHQFLLNHRLEVILGPQEASGTIFDKEKAIGTLYNRYVANYNKVIFILGWNNEIKFARRSSLAVLGEIIKPDKNTLEYALNAGVSWNVKQRIVGGHRGNFDRLGYRKIPDRLYDRLIQ